MRTHTRLHLLAIGFYAALALCALYLIVFTTGTHTAGFDFFNYNWNFWWIRHATTTPGLNLYLNDFVMFPAMSNYGYHALAAVWYPLWALLEPVTGTLAAVNIILVLGCFLNGYVTFVFLRSERIAPGWALLGGAALQILPITRYFYYNTHLNLMDWFWLPGLLLIWQQIAHHARAAASWPRLIAWALVLGLGIWGLGLTDLQFPIFAAFVLVPAGLRTLLKYAREDRPALLRVIGAAAIAVGVGAALLWFAGPVPHMLRFQGRLEPGTAEDRPGIPLPGGFLNMAAGWWNWNEPSLGAFITIYVGAAVAVALIARRRAGVPGRKGDAWYWFALMLPPLILAMGPTLHLGDAEIPLPYRVMHTLTSGMFRMPWRLAPIAVLCGVVFAGKIFTDNLFTDNLFTGSARQGHMPARAFTGAAAMLLLAASVRLFEPAPLVAAPADFAFYHAVGQEQGDPYDREVVLEVPTGAGTGEVLLGDPRAIQLQWYGRIHEKRMLNGFISRAAIDPIWYIVQDDPMLAWLGGRRQLDPEAVSAQLRERIFSWPIGYLVVHADIIGADSITLAEVVSFLNSQSDLLCAPLEQQAVNADGTNTIIAYRTRWQPDGCAAPYRRLPPLIDGAYRIDLGAAGDWPYLGAGWHYREPVGSVDWRWAGAAPQATLYADLPAGDYTMAVTAQAFAEPRSLRALVNGTPLAGEYTVSPDGLGEYRFLIPAAPMETGDSVAGESVIGSPVMDSLATESPVTVTFEYGPARTPAELGTSTDTRPLAIAVDQVTFTPQDGLPAPQ